MRMDSIGTLSCLDMRSQQGQLNIQDVRALIHKYMQHLSLCQGAFRGSGNEKQALEAVMQIRNTN